MSQNYNFFPKCTGDGKIDREKLVNSIIRYQFSRTNQMFRWNGLNAETDPPVLFIERYLQLNGQALFAEFAGKLYAFFGGAGGEPSPYYLPTTYVVSNPALNLSKTYTIGVDSVWGWNDSMAQGLMPMFTRYASAMADNEISLRMADIIARVQWFISGADDDTRASAERFLQKLVEGDMTVIAEKNFLDKESFRLSPAANNSNNILSTLIEYEQYLKASWFNELGLNANYNMKREAVNSQEAQMGDAALLPLCDDMLNCRKRLCSQVNEMFGRNWSVEFNSSWEVLEEEMTAEPEEQEEEVNADETDDNNEGSYS